MPRAESWPTREGGWTSSPRDAPRSWRERARKPPGGRWYDFFTPQPIKGARTSYMHGVLHDWSDEPARKILEMQRETLVPGLSNLLVHGHIAPQALTYPYTTAYNLTTTIMVAGKERTEEY
ncbi:hypothetical protein F4801DRAFT_582106 [Xylaria longipes]|nr:hypothetical protein F4801DRAFT_582106 [Xylaria longipes]